MVSLSGDAAYRRMPYGPAGASEVTSAKRRCCALQLHCAVRAQHAMQFSGAIDDSMIPGIRILRTDVLCPSRSRDREKRCLVK